MAQPKKKSYNAVIDGGDVATSLTDRAYAVIEEMIVTLQFKPGAVLSETALSKRLEIGRTPILTSCAWTTP